MSGNPSYIRRTPVYISRRILEDIFEGIFRVDHISSTGMHDTFGLACRTGRVQNVKHVLAVHFFCQADLFLVGYFIMPPSIPAWLHAYLLMGSLVNNHRFHTR